MTIFEKAYCRIYQKVIFLVEFFLPWGEPEMLTGPGSIRKLPEFVKSKGVDNVLVVTDKGLMGIHLLDSLFEELDKAGVEYKKLLAEENPDLANAYGVTQAPTLVVNGEKIVNLSNIKAFIENAKA